MGRCPGGLRQSWQAQNQGASWTVPPSVHPQLSWCHARVARTRWNIHFSQPVMVYIYIHVIICIDNMSNEFQEYQEFHVHAFILWYNFTDLNIGSIAEQSDFWCVFVAIEWTPTEYLCLVDLSGWFSQFSHTDIFLIRLDLEHDPTAIISKQNFLMPLQNTARSKLVFFPAPIYSIQNPCYSIMETLSMKACLVSIWMISPILCNGSTDAFTLRTQTVLSIGLANLADPFG